MAERQESTISRLIGYTPEANKALARAAERMGISEDEAANNAAIVYDQIVHAGMGPGKTLLILDDRTREIEGGVRISTRIVATESSDVERVAEIVPFPSDSEASDAS